MPHTNVVSVTTVVFATIVVLRRVLVRNEPVIPREDSDVEFFRKEFRHYIDSLDDDCSLAFPTWLDPSEKWSRQVERVNRLQLLVSVYFVAMVFLILFLWKA